MVVAPHSAGSPPTCSTAINRPNLERYCRATWPMAAPHRVATPRADSYAREVLDEAYRRALPGSQDPNQLVKHGIGRELTG
jgi:hypothetical protein